MAYYDYRIAANWNVALGSLTNIEDISQIAIAPRSTPVNAYPVRTVVISGREFGDGRIDHEWLYSALPTTALYHYIDTYAGSTAVSGQVTIYTRKRAGTYGRYNAWLIRPIEGEDYTLDATCTIALDLVLRFRGLVEL